MQLTDEQIKKATEWWADRVCNPAFNGLTAVERKDPANDAHQLAEIMAASNVRPVANEDRQRFVAALEEELRDEAFNAHWGLSVDYHPWGPLAHAAEKAGISKSNFPWKTHMCFDEDGSVKASSGYGAPMKTL